MVKKTTPKKTKKPQVAKAIKASAKTISDDNKLESWIKKHICFCKRLEDVANIYTLTILMIAVLIISIFNLKISLRQKLYLERSYQLHSEKNVAPNSEIPINVMREFMSASAITWINAKYTVPSVTSEVFIKSQQDILKDDFKLWDEYAGKLKKDGYAQYIKIVNTSLSGDKVKILYEAHLVKGNEIKKTIHQSIVEIKDDTSVGTINDVSFPFTVKELENKLK